MLAFAAMPRLRLIGGLLLPAALAVAATGFAWWAGAGLPYQDATPELLRQQQADLRRGRLLMLGGLLVFIADGVWLWKTRPGRHERSTTRLTDP